MTALEHSVRRRLLNLVCRRMPGFDMKDEQAFASWVRERVRNNVLLAVRVTVDSAAAVLSDTAADGDVRTRPERDAR